MDRICGIQVGRCEPDGLDLTENLWRRDTGTGNIFMMLDRKRSRWHWCHQGVRPHLWICTADGQCRGPPIPLCTQTPTQTHRNPAFPHGIPQAAHWSCPYLPLLQSTQRHKWRLATLPLLVTQPPTCWHQEKQSDWASIDFFLFLPWQSFVTMQILWSSGENVTLHNIKL